MGSNSRHTKHLPTKEVFYRAFAPTTNGGTQERQGVVIDATNENASIIVYVPHDFAALDELMLVVRPRPTVDLMWVRVFSEYNEVGNLYYIHQADKWYSFAAFTNRNTEIDVSGILENHALGPSTYLNVGVSRLAVLPVENTNLWVVGVRLKYKYR